MPPPARPTHPPCSGGERILRRASSIAISNSLQGACPASSGSSCCVEMMPVVLAHQVLDDAQDRILQLAPPLERLLQLVRPRLQGVGRRQVPASRGPGDVSARAHRAELELVPGEGEGEVRLRSPASRGSCGSTATPVSSRPPFLAELAPPFSICSKTSVSMSPRKTEMRAGGLVGPRRWSLPAWAMDARISPASGPRRAAWRRRTSGMMFVVRVVPGFKRLFPRSSDSTS